MIRLSFSLLLPVLLLANESANVLVVVNDATIAETGTNGIGASQFVADHYIAARGIPATNVVHINSKGCCGFADGPDVHIYNNFHVSLEQFKIDIENPIRAYLEGRNLKHQIKYIVTTYGVPTHIGQLPPFEQLSVDSFLSQMYAHPDFAQFPNPLFTSDPTSKPPHWTNEGVAAPIYLVCRLDGPTALIANGLVDKAMTAEKGISKTSGTGYYDYQGNLPIVNADGTMLNGYNLCVSAGMKCVLNDQSKTRHMINSAPDTLWAWGWYGGVNDVYEFVPGAVGAQLTSYTANDIRNINNPAGFWVPWWLTKGITATWGATGEPYHIYYATGDNLLNHLWNGYTFGESAYIANSLLGWMMIFVGDPLYSPNFSLAPTSITTPPVTTAPTPVSPVTTPPVTIPPVTIPPVSIPPVTPPPVQPAPTGGGGLAITTSSLVNGLLNTPYSAALVATGTGQVTWSVIAGGIPAGLMLNSSTGVISGVPGGYGTWSFTVQASSSAGVATKAFNLTIGY